MWNRFWFVWQPQLCTYYYTVCVCFKDSPWRCNDSFLSHSLLKTERVLSPFLSPSTTSFLLCSLYVTLHNSTALFVSLGLQEAQMCQLVDVILRQQGWVILFLARTETGKNYKCNVQLQKLHLLSVTCVLKLWLMISQAQQQTYHRNKEHLSLKIAYRSVNKRVCITINFKGRNINKKADAESGHQ